MTFIQSFKEAVIQAPLSLRHLKRGSLQWMLIYLLLNLILFSFFSWALLSNQALIKATLLAYFFPESWHRISETLGEFLFESQAKTVLGNLILSGSLVFASIFLFPVKEKYAAQFEKDARYQNGISKEFPLIYQAIEESKLLLLYITAQGVILWIGYYPYLWANILSITLSYLFLFFTFGLDFISPTLQRHRISYTHILKVLLNQPISPLLFGLLFSLPSLLLSQIIFRVETLTLIEIASILFLGNILFLTLAIPAGTHLASYLMSVVKTISPTSKMNKIYGYTFTLIIFASILFLHGKLITSLHHKSQLLKAEYEVDWSSINYQLPAISQLLNGKAFSNISFDIKIRNPTEYDIVIENSKIIVEKNSNIVATVNLNGFEVPSESTRKIKVQLDTESQLSYLTNLEEILENWHIELHLALWPGIPLVMNLYSSN